MQPRKILLADDHSLMRDAIQQLLSRSFAQLVFEFSSNFVQTAHCLTEWQEHADSQTAVIILDLRMPGMNGLDSVQTLLDLASPHPVIIYSELASSVTYHQLIHMGVFAVAYKSNDADELLNYVRTALDTANNQADAPLLPVDVVYSKQRLQPTQNELSPPNNIELTSRQLDMLRALHAGLPNKMIAREYGLALGTVKNHLFILYERLGVKSRSEALSKTREWFL
ncbi:DNA-binding response regulator, NarL/FixJ family, contains REC and HTH domains [Thiothrix eikelboomii]|uniref:DNA-binding response regulator, NarL/FixJ family, contains REC and HTH domains n=1 Tax=Thiothrix eikelboomii TaxID=92487 RepID=A0A1T4W7Y3_9GAMM|nr:response regulator transcription factor [Thiothrix eikelboomii]SKA73402.1 DNA-binding response regulator, NarL/FixJ family, contains REC and HTH domains [Thiothrix eikelboomii]